ncbi:hypothetical protein IFM89_008795, partial [Coptis chinensis]
KCWVELPDSLFISKSLRVLKCDCGLEFEPPTSISLPALETLHLSSTLFLKDNIVELLKSCPVLESLMLEDLQLYVLKKFTIYAPQVKHLEIRNWFGLEPARCKIEIYAPNLLSLKCADHMKRDFWVETLCSPHIADFCMQVGMSYEEDNWLPEEQSKKYIMRMMNYLRAVRNVKSLVISPLMVEVLKPWCFSCAKVFSKTSATLGSLSMQFLNLRVMVLENISVIQQHSDSICGILRFLNISPNVETLTVKVTKDVVMDLISGSFAEECCGLGGDECGCFQKSI